jgi:multiple sugar transport system ATP-binding protein
MTLGDKVAIMRDGVLQQFAPPRELYAHPTNLFVASFIGSPAMNLVRTHVEQRNGVTYARLGGQTFLLPHARSSMNELLDRPIVLGIRPEDLEDAELTAKDVEPLVVRVAIKEDLGAEVFVHATIAPAPGEVVLASLEESLAGMQPASGETSLVARVGRLTQAEEGRDMRLAIDTSHIYLFDAESGRTLLSPA